LVAVCAGSDVMHPIGALFTGLIAGGLFVWLFTYMQRKFPTFDDVLGVWPLHGMCGLWGGIAAGIFGLESLGGLGGVSFMSQLIGSIAGVLFAVLGGFIVYYTVNKFMPIRLSEEDEFNGADIAIHQIGATSLNNK
ncbi:MAG: ammonium transporter, partial [Psychromonas sp.]|nr:ammonium transporter [Psychromonas sp.]